MAVSSAFSRAGVPVEGVRGTACVAGAIRRASIFGDGGARESLAGVGVSAWGLVFAGFDGHRACKTCPSCGADRVSWPQNWPRNSARAFGLRCLECVGLPRRRDRYAREEECGLARGHRVLGSRRIARVNGDVGAGKSSRSRECRQNTNGKRAQSPNDKCRAVHIPPDVPAPTRGCCSLPNAWGLPHAPTCAARQNACKTPW